MKIYNLVILGAGPAGLTAAIYGRRAGLNSLVIENETQGGQIRLTNSIENWPGTISISGYDLGENFYTHARSMSVEFLLATVEKLRLEQGRRFVLTSVGELEAEAVIVATGARFNQLGIPGEVEFTGRGVSYCAVCDAPFFRGQTVAVVGGGNAAVEEAEYLTRFTERVFLIHRRTEFRAVRHLVDKVLANNKITPVLAKTVTAIEGNIKGVTRIRLKCVRNGEESSLDVSGVFIFVGIIPRLDFLGDFLKTGPGGWISTDKHLAASQPGFFAAGDVRDTDLRQVVTAVADGARAAINAYRFLNNPK